MDKLPDHLVGHIFSLIGDAKTIINASATSRRFKDVVRFELDLLRFDFKDWNGFYNLTSDQLEICITETVRLSNRLKSLMIGLKGNSMISDTCITEWLLHTRETLNEFCYFCWTTPNLNNVLVNLQALSNLEVLSLGHSHIVEVPYHLRLDRLRSLSLTDVIVSSPDLKRIVAACEKIELLNLNSLVVDEDGENTRLELHIPTLVEGCLTRINVKELVLNMERLERLKVKDGRIEGLFVEGKHHIRVLKLIAINSLESVQVDEMAEFVEVVHIRKLEISWNMIYNAIGSSRFIKKLILSEVDEVNFDAIATQFLLLEKLSVTYSEAIQNLSVGYQFTGLQTLEIEWIRVDEKFSVWVKNLLEMCPELVKCVFRGYISKLGPEELHGNMKLVSRLFRVVGQPRFTKVHFDFQYA